MQPQVTYPPSPPPSTSWLRFLGRHISLLLFLGLAMGGMMATYWYFSPIGQPGEALAVAAASADAIGLTAPIVKTIADQPVSQRLPQSPGPLRIGIIAGHLDNDSGAACVDGLTEAQVTKQIAERIASTLLAEGINTEILAEFDPRLNGYTATALISIHADSCDYINDLATGFKISGSPFTDSTDLSVCVEQAYRNATEMPYHPNSITPHMTNYHAFREIAPGTPALIIEVGFLNLDREMLTTNVDKPIAGLISGIRCFLDK
jgi:N-acetylmuramoyl-L-alanine amidase